MPLLIAIPEERVPILVGKNGEIKRKIQEMGKCTLSISQRGDVQVISDNAADEWNLRDVIHAIGRGFNPEIALKLFSDDFYLEVINLRDYLKNEHAMQRQKARIIGTQGKTKKTIEELASVNLSIYGHTISIIGDQKGLSLAKDAIMMFLDGKTHSTVYMYLEQQARADKMFLGNPPEV